MPNYLLLTNLTDKGIQTLRSSPGRLLEVNREVEALGARVVQQWAALGPWDFVNVVEAPDDLTVAQIAIAVGARGSAKITSVPLIEIEDLLAGLGG
jgi:uncharacterized protein with GYD domain